MSNTMTTETPPPPPGGGAWNPTELFGGLRRSDDDRWISGLAGGIGRRWGIEPWIVRLGFVAAAFVGIGLALYVVGWLLLPSDSRPAYAQRRGWTRNTAIAVGAVVVLVLGGLAWMDGDGPGWLLAVVLVGAGLGLLLRDRPAPPTGDRDETAPTPPPPTVDHPAQPVVAPDPPPRPRRRSFLTPVTLLGLVAFVGIAIAASDARWNEPGVVLSIALATIGAVLLLASWIGRARGLVIVGLLLLPPLLAAAATDGAWRDWSGDLEVRPITAAALEDHYEWGFGRRVLDLSGLRLAAGRSESVEVDQIAGDLEVLLPPGVTVDLQAEVGAGVIDLDAGPTDRAARREGLGIDLDRTLGSSADRARIELDVELGAGNLQIRPSTAVSEEGPR